MPITQTALLVMEMEKMSAVENKHPRRKTRRGKRNRKMAPYKKVCLLPIGSISMTDTVSNDSDLCHSCQKKNGRRVDKLIRPMRPAAPLNSTQFLIHDRDGVFDTRPLYEKVENVQDEKLDDSPNLEDIEYEPLEDTYSFMKNDFEKVFAEIYYDNIATKSKSELVNDYEELMNEYETSVIELRSCENKMEMENTTAILSENSRLRDENERLRQELARLTTRYRV